MYEEYSVVAALTKYVLMYLIESEMELRVFYLELRD